MRVTEQIDALEATAVDSFSYLAVTRIVACAVALPLLTVVMNFSGLVGGAVAESALTGTSLELFFRRAFAALTFTEYTAATLKTLVFGLIIGTVSTHVGYHTRGGSAGVGGAATRSVVVSSLLLILINVLLVKTIAVLFPGI
jgi:phospholipid/cholesterol/gamma-HCH transport system permease protein